MERMSNGKNSVNGESQVDEEVNRSPVNVNWNNGQQIQRATTSAGSASQRWETPEKRRMFGSVVSMSEGVDSPFGKIRVKEEPVDEFTQNNILNETPSMEVDSEFDIKEEDVGYGQSKLRQNNSDNSIHNPLNTDQSSDIPIKHEIDRSIQRMFRSADKVSNTESVSGNFGTDSELNHISSSGLTKKLICPKLVEPLLQVTRPGLRGQKKNQPHLTTRPAEKMQCKNCSAAFDTRYKLMKHNESGKCKAPFNCPNCGKCFATERVFTNHLKTHNGEKKKQPTSVGIDTELRANRKRSLSLESKEGKPRDRPKKRRKVVDTEAEVCNDVEMPVVVGEIIDSPCVFERSFKEENILRIILSNLEKNDLLNARLVSHAWNDASLKVLRMSNFTQRLRLKKMKEYIRFMTSIESHPFIIPFHLDFCINLSSLKLANRYRQLSRVESLCKTFGAHCVSTLTLTSFYTKWTEENFKDIGLIECLSLFSPGLKTLDLKYFHVGFDFLKNQTITFPNLKKITCNTLDISLGKTGPAALAYISIIENSPDLENLTVTHPCDLESWPLKFNQLKYLSFDSMFKPQKFLGKILTSPSPGPPVLRELSCGFNWLGFNDSRIAEDKIAVYNILKLVSPTLRSFKFRGYSFARNSGNLRLPKLPHLEHLGLEWRIGRTCRTDAEDIGFRPEKFPSLMSIELPIGFIFTPSPVQSKENDNVRIEFPNLIKLILRVGDTGLENLNEPLEQLQQIFPTPSKLCLVNTGGNDFVKYVLYRIMKSNWSKSIQQIEMIGFSRDDDLGGLLLERMELGSRVNLEEWYERLEESLKTEFQNTMKRIIMEFEESAGFRPIGCLILRRTNQLRLSN